MGLTSGTLWTLQAALQARCPPPAGPGRVGVPRWGRRAPLPPVRGDTPEQGCPFPARDSRPTCVLCGRKQGGQTLCSGILFHPKTGCWYAGVATASQLVPADGCAFALHPGSQELFGTRAAVQSGVSSPPAATGRKGSTPPHLPCLWHKTSSDPQRSG